MVTEAAIYLPTPAAVRLTQLLGFPLPILLSRRTNIRSLAEIEERRRACMAARVTDDAPDETMLSAKQLERQARNQRIADMWLAGNGYKEIQEATGIPKNSVGSIIGKLGLQGKGGHCKRPFVMRAPA
jgi:hypothetical protein